MLKLAGLIWSALYSLLGRGSTKNSARSYSQEGEDMVVRRLVGDKRDGFYVDVGAHHPWRFSNTQYFYSTGWRGINLDPLPGSMRIFNRVRPRDINLEAAAGKPGVLNYYMYDEPAVNTFDEGEVAKREKQVDYPYKLIGKQKVPVRALADIIEEHAPGGRIDLLSVDVEGKDLEVLQTNDWKKFRPRVVLAECHGATMGDLSGTHKLARYLADQGYKPVAKTLSTVAFIDER